MPTCTCPLAGVSCVDRLYTEFAVSDLTPDGAAVRETFGISFDALRDRLDVPLVRPSD